MSLFSFNKSFKSDKSNVNNDQSAIVKLDYNTDTGFVLDSIVINWGDDRELIREKLNNQHKCDDRTIELAQFFDGDESQIIEQRRDIYKNYNGQENYFFFNYDLDGQIKEIEFHWGIEIMINNIALRFGEQITTIVDRLADIDNKYKQIEEGNYLFPTLKMTISDSEHSGGDGHGFACFYASENIDHLLDD